MCQILTRASQKTVALQEAERSSSPFILLQSRTLHTLSFSSGANHNVPQAKTKLQRSKQYKCHCHAINLVQEWVTGELRRIPEVEQDGNLKWPYSWTNSNIFTMRWVYHLDLVWAQHPKVLAEQIAVGSSKWVKPHLQKEKSQLRVTSQCDLVEHSLPTPKIMKPWS